MEIDSTGGGWYGICVCKRNGSTLGDFAPVGTELLCCRARCRRFFDRQDLEYPN